MILTLREQLSLHVLTKMRNPQVKMGTNPQQRMTNLKPSDGGNTGGGEDNGDDIALAEAKHYKKVQMRVRSDPHQSQK